MQSKNVLLFNPPSGLYRRDNRCQNRVEDQTVSVAFPPMELLYCASVLERAGHKVWVRDYPVQGSSWQTFIDDLHEIKPDYAIFTATVATLDHDMSTVAAIKEHFPSAIVAAKGEPIHYMDEELINDLPKLDIILRGEVEAYIADLVNGKDWHELPGVTFKHNGMVIRNEISPNFLDLDELPMPARHLINNRMYISPETRNPLTTVVTSLGCPHKCIYCSVPALTGTNVRFRSPKLVVDELESCVNHLGVREFLFHADTFTLKKKWVIELCQEIIKRGLDIRWGCNSRVDTIDSERLHWMKKAGCWVIGFGVETGNDEHLEMIKKRATAEQAFEAIRLCREHGVRSHTFLVFGFPWDTEETIQELIAFAKELDPDFFDFNIAYPLPGTELEQMVEEQGLFSRERRQNGGYAVGSVSTQTLSPEELEKWRKKALWSMYLRPHYIFRTFKQAGSLPVLLNYLRAAVNRAFNLLKTHRNKEAHASS